MRTLKPNRQQATKPKLGYSWCWKCGDSYHEIGVKCPKCNAPPERRKSLKKDTNAR